MTRELTIGGLSERSGVNIVTKNLPPAFRQMLLHIPMTHPHEFAMYYDI